MIEGALLDLVEFPMRGRHRPDLPAGYRSRLVDQHVIYYRVEEDGIYVSRIAHMRRDITAKSLVSLLTVDSRFVERL